MVIQAIRSLFFYLLFIGQTAILAIVLGTVGLFSDKWLTALWPVARYWAASNLVMLRWLTGIRSEISGTENIPETGCIIVSKHQSDWDIFALMPHVENPAFIAKKELIDIPFFGKVASAFGTISIDRKKGGQAIPAMVDDARKAIENKRHIIIFPEGTRKAPLADLSYKSGAARLYEQLNVPVVPVAVNSGLFWGRNSPVLWPGIAKARFLPPIPAGLDGAEMQRRMIAAIEPATEELIIEAAKKGLARPLSAELRARLDVLMVNKG